MARNEAYINWRKSPAREIILQDLLPGGRLHGRDNVRPNVIWDEYKDRPEFDNVPYKQFRERLAGHRKQVRAKLTSAANKKPKKINWMGSAARQILLDDLQPPHGILVGKDDVPAVHLWKFYKTQPGFEKVPYKQFCVRLRDHRNQMSGNYLLSCREEEFLGRDRKLYPRQTVNNRGEIVFDLHPARDLLRQDVANKLHLTMKPSELRRTRPEYKVFKKKIFKHRVYQTIRREKFINYLEHKRLEKRHGIPNRPRNMNININL